MVGEVFCGWVIYVWGCDLGGAVGSLRFVVSYVLLWPMFVVGCFSFGVGLYRLGGCLRTCRLVPFERRRLCVVCCVRCCRVLML